MPDQCKSLKRRHCVLRSDTRHHKFSLSEEPRALARPRPPQPRAEAGPISLAQTAAAPALPRLSSGRAKGRDSAAEGRGRPRGPPRRVALPPYGAALQEGARARACGGAGTLPRGRPGVPQPPPSRRRTLPFASALPQNGGRRAPRAATAGCADWLHPPAGGFSPPPAFWLAEKQLCYFRLPFPPCPAYCFRPARRAPRVRRPAPLLLPGLRRQRVRGCGGRSGGGCRR